MSTREVAKRYSEISPLYHRDCARRCPRVACLQIARKVWLKPRHSSQSNNHRVQPATASTIEVVATRRCVIEAAREHFTRRGFSATTLRDIADEVGVTRSAIYYHFPNKLDLFGAVLDEVNEAVLTPCITAARAAGAAAEQWRELLAGIRCCPVEKRSAVAFLVTAALESQRRPDVRALVCARLTDLRAFLGSTGDVDGAGVEMMLSILWGWALATGLS